MDNNERAASEQREHDNLEGEPRPSGDDIRSGAIVVRSDDEQR